MSKYGLVELVGYCDSWFLTRRIYLPIYPNQVHGNDLSAQYNS